MRVQDYLNRVKIWHDKKIKRKEFKVGDQVLLFNSHFKFSAGKLASKWTGPLVVQEVYRSEAIRLYGDFKGKPRVVNGQRLKQYIAGQTFAGVVEIMDLQSPEAMLAKIYSLPEPKKHKKVISRA